MKQQEKKEIIEYDIDFAKLLFVFIFAWLLVARWEVFIEDFCYETLELQRGNTSHSFWIAACLTIVLGLLVFSFESLLNPIDSEIKINKT